MCNIFSSSLSSIKLMDILGENINFTIDKKTTFKTVYGGILSLFLYVIYIIMFYHFGKNILNPYGKSNPNISYEEKISKIPQNITFNKTHFLFGIRIEDEDSNYFNHTNYFYHSLLYKIYDYKSKIFNEKNLKLRSCADLNFTIEGNTIDGDSKDFFHSVNMSEWLCPDLSEETDLTISGDWEDDIIKYLEFKLSFCKEQKKQKNEINFSDCKNHSEFLNHMLMQNNYYVSIILKRFRTDYKNYADPYDYKLMKIYNKIYDKLKKTDELHLSKVMFIDDKGLIFEKDEINIYDEELAEDKDIFISNDFNSFKSSSGYSNINELNITKDTNTHYSLHIISESVTRIYKRKYKKIQEVIAEVMGSMEYFLFLFKLFYCAYANFRFDMLLFNRLVNIPDYLKINNNVFNNKMGHLSRKYRNDNQNQINIPNDVINNKKINNKAQENKEKKSKTEIIKKILKFEIKKKLKNNEMEMNVFSFFKNKNIMKQNFLENEQVKEQELFNSKNFNEASICNTSIPTNKTISKNIQVKNKFLSKDFNESELNNNKNIRNNKIASEDKDNIKIFSQNKNAEEKDISKKTEPKEEKADISFTIDIDPKNKSNIVIEDNSQSNSNIEPIIKSNTLEVTEVNKEFVQSIYDSYKNKKNTVNLIFIHYICIFFRCTKRKKFYFYMKDKVSERFLSKFDIFYYFKKIRNINLIKKILFTKNQMKLVDFISNKYYTIDNLKKLRTKNDLLEEEEFLKCYKNLDENNMIDGKILEEINNEM